MIICAYALACSSQLRETLEKYVSARLAEFLVGELGDLAIITKRNGHFVTLLPETNRANLSDVLRKLQLSAKEKLGLQLKIGVSTFPDEAVTFERMLEDAESEMTNAKLPSSVRVEKNASELSANVTLEPASQADYCKRVLSSRLHKRINDA